MASMDGVRPYTELRDAVARRDRSLRSKTMSLADAADRVFDGESLGIGGSMMSRTPMAMLWQLMRARRKNLVCSRPIITSEGDLLLGSGMSRHVITSWFSQGIMWGVSKVMRHYVENGPRALRRMEPPRDRHALARRRDGRSLHADADDAGFGRAHRAGRNARDAMPLHGGANPAGPSAQPKRRDNPCPSI